MNILDVSERVSFPPVDGSTTRICQLLRHLSRDHEVRQFSLARFEHLRSRPFARQSLITSSYREYRYFHPLPALAWELARRPTLREPLLSWAGLRLSRPRRLRRWTEWADVVLVEYPWQFSYCSRLGKPAPIVLATHNVEAANRASYAQAAGVSGERTFWFKSLVEIERCAVTGADLVLAVSQDDRETFITRYGADPGRIVVIRNGADTDRYAPVDAERKQALRRQLGFPAGPVVIYLAGGRNAARAAGLAWVRRVAETMQGVTFVVTGTLFPRPCLQGNVMGIGFVDDPLPYLQAADVSLCPIEFGGGTKIKVLEALAVGLPTVVFADAIRGLAVRHSDHVWVSDKNEQSLAAAIGRVLRDRELAARLGRAGREYVVGNHDWKKLAGELEAALLCVAQAQGGGREAGSSRSEAIELQAPSACSPT